jgi:hypothetical protein
MVQWKRKNGFGFSGKMIPTETQGLPPWRGIRNENRRSPKG